MGFRNMQEKLENYFLLLEPKVFQSCTKLITLIKLFQTRRDSEQMNEKKVKVKSKLMK